MLYNVDLRIPTLHYDRLVHAFGFGTSSVACWQALRLHISTRPISGGIAFLIALCGMGIGAVNEVVEFVSTEVVETSNVGGYANTGWDLVFNAAGCTVAALSLYHLDRRRRQPARVDTVA
ncbi:MAG TPA: hypothetical protein VEM93_04460 [Actinomycetota bacterium]|nr:hypothetical protein [Actinomycetota bacterium]